jgi:TonB family protein
MIKICSFILFLFACNSSLAQTLETSYFFDEDLQQKTIKNKGYFIATTTTNADGTKAFLLTTRKGSTIRQEYYKGKEPIGKWTLNTNGQIRALDYDFELVYGKPVTEKLDSNIFLLFKPSQLPFIDDESRLYKAPLLLNGETTIPSFVSKNIAYPQSAIQKEIQGRVQVKFILSENGIVEDIAVIQGVDVLLDKEAMRIIKLLKFSSPATLNGIKKKIYFIQSVIFRLEY